MATFIVKYHGLTLDHEEDNLTPRYVEAQSPVDACFVAAVTAPSTDYREWEAEVASAATTPMYRICDTYDVCGEPTDIMITNLKNGYFMILGLTQAACILRDGVPSRQATFEFNKWCKPID